MAFDLTPAPERPPQRTALPYLAFARAHRRALAFGVLLTFFSSFGQTFLVSLFVPDLLRAFELDSARFGALYAVATLASAASLYFLGSLLDRTRTARFTLGAGVTLLTACFLVAFAPNAGALGLGLVGLRLAGQGLLSLIATTTMARRFEVQRGKALVLAGLGWPLGEAVLPGAVLGLIGSLGWRATWVVIAISVGILLLPLAHWLADGPNPPSIAEHVGTPRLSRPRLLRDWRFFALLPGMLFLPFVLTALLLYQLALAELRGWAAETLAAGFVAFAATRVGASLWAGALVDRFGALRMFPFALVPMCAGLVALCSFDSAWVALLYLGLAGASLGLTSPLGTAVWAEVYGVRALGAIKGAVAVPNVAATAAGPLLFGWLLGEGISFDRLLQASGALGVACILLGFASRAALARDQLPTSTKSGSSGSGSRVSDR